MPPESAARPACPPGRYRTLAVDGRDAATFLQGQLTQDVLSLEPEALRVAALLTPAGRVTAVAWVTRRADGFALVLPASLATAVLERLRRFVLRSKVGLALDELDAGLAARIAASLPAAATAAAGQPDASESWSLALVRAGHPEIGPATSEEWIPQMLNLDLLGGVSFEKGCYTGQEIVARTQHLGRIKRRMFRYVAATSEPPAAKAGLYAGGEKVGEVVLAAHAPAGVELLAVANLGARDRPLALDTATICSPEPLPYPVP